MRGLPLALFALVTLLLGAPVAGAVGEHVDIVDVQVPARTVGAKAFNVSVTLENRDAVERNVTLMGALYAPRGPGDTPCGPATSPRFRDFTHVVQPVFRIPARATVTFPEEGDRWPNLYLPDDAQEELTEYEFCVFAAENEHTQNIDYYDFHSVALATRARNAPPSGGFTFAPDDPTAAQDVTFTATGEDPDGDPVEFAWDFGHANASGQARAFGPVALHPFYPDGVYTVTLLVSDGFDQTRVTRTVLVMPEPDVDAPTVQPTTQEANADTPAPAGLAFVAFVLVALGLRRR